ncbi:MAG: hypothetical protein WAM70_20530, partial [Pyrinomonadaceae bacterium]
MKKKSVFMRGAIVSALFAVTIPVALGRTYANNDPTVGHNSVARMDDPEAVYQGARIVHNVTVKGQKGMRVHAKFTVKHGHDVACKMIAYFYYDDSDNTPLKASDARYRTKTGNVSAQTNFTPAYDPAVYNDLQIFIPYEALNMESGEEHDLKFY